MSWKLFSISGVSSMVVIGLSAWSSAAVSGSPSPVDARLQYKPFEAMSHAFGSKFMGGYFVEQAAQCVVTLMVMERSDSDTPFPVTATRVRLLLYPGQVAGLDSAEGRSLNFTCGERAKSLTVDVGERDMLVARQGHDIAMQVGKTQ